MSSFQPSIWLRKIQRKAVHFLALLSFCAASLPLPVPKLTLGEKVQSQPFPCQNSPCGCHTAEQCWTSCCCLTPKERFAWAAKNHVIPPSYAEQPDSVPAPGTQKFLTSTSADSSNAKNPCCSTTAVKASREHDNQEKRLNSCCSADNDHLKTECSLADKETEERETRELAEGQAVPKSRVVLSILALKCHGKSSSVTMLPWTVVPNISKWLLHPQETEDVVLTSVPDPAVIFLRPDTPPPRLSLS